MSDPFQALLSSDVEFGRKDEPKPTSTLQSSPRILKTAKPLHTSHTPKIKTHRGIDMPPPLVIPSKLSDMKADLKQRGWNPLDLNKSELTELYQNPDCGDNYECVMHHKMHINHYMYHLLDIHKIIKLVV